MADTTEITGETQRRNELPSPTSWAHHCFHDFSVTPSPARLGVLTLSALGSVSSLQALQDLDAMLHKQSLSPLDVSIKIKI